MIDAAQANKIAKEATDNADKEQTEKIHKSIMEAANKGQLVIYISYTIRPAVKQKLERLGYNVNTSSNRNESSTSITW